MPYLGFFGLELLKTIAIFEISTLEFNKHESLTHTVDFDIGFLNVWLGSTFSESLGPLYKVCRFSF